MRLAILLFVAVATAASAQEPMFTRWVWDGVYSARQAQRGEKLYATHCADCHSPDLLGRPAITTPAGTPVVHGAPALRGSEFIANWTDLPLGTLYERIRISMPQSAPGSLTRQMNADILAYVLQENGYNAGPEELPAIQAMLDSIRIDR